MPITIDEIKKNDVNVKEADLSVTPFDKKFAADLAEALKNNSNINKLSMSMSDIRDDEFGIVANALLLRPTNLLELNIDLTDITEACLPEIENLIEKGKVKVLFMYKLKNIHENPDVIKKLAKLAKDNGVKVFFDNPNDRKKVGFFAGSEVNQKDNFVDDEKEEQIPKLK